MKLRTTALLWIGLVPLAAYAQSAPMNPYNIRTGTSAGTVAAGNDSRITGAIQPDTDGTVSSKPVKPAGASSTGSLAAITGQMRPHVANNAALSAATLYAYVGATVSRDGFATAGDGGQAVYTYTSAACGISGGDGGTQVPATIGGCWVVDPTTPITIELFAGAIGRNDGTVGPDAQPALQAALNTCLSVHLGPFQYHLKEQALATCAGQDIGGTHRAATALFAYSDWTTPNTALLKTAITAHGNEGPHIHDIYFLAYQPAVNTSLSISAQMASLIQVSCLDIRDTISTQIDRIFASACMRGIDMRGTTGQTVINDVKGANFISGIDIDGAQDTVVIRDFHEFPFALPSGTPQLIAENGSCGIRSGRMDDLKVEGGLSIQSNTGMCFYEGVARTDSADGYSSPGGQTTGSISDFDFDVSPNGINVAAGNISITGGYNVAQVQAISNAAFLRVSNTSITVNATNTVSNSGYLLLNSSVINDGNDFTAVRQIGGTLVFNDNLYNWGEGGNTTLPKVNAACCRVVAHGNSVNDHGSGTSGPNSTFFTIGSGEYYDIGGNLAPGWLNSYPAPTVAETTPNTVTLTAGATDEAGTINYTVGEVITLVFNNYVDHAPACILSGGLVPASVTGGTPGQPGQAAMTFHPTAAGSTMYLCK